MNSITPPGPGTNCWAHCTHLGSSSVVSGGSDAGGSELGAGAGAGAAGAGGLGAGGGGAGGAGAGGGGAGAGGGGGPGGSTAGGGSESVEESERSISDVQSSEPSPAPPSICCEALSNWHFTLLPKCRTATSTIIATRIMPIIYSAAPWPFVQWICLARTKLSASYELWFLPCRCARRLYRR